MRNCGYLKNQRTTDLGGEKLAPDATSNHATCHSAARAGQAFGQCWGSPTDVDDRLKSRMIIPDHSTLDQPEQTDPANAAATALP